LPEHALRAGAALAILNAEPTPFDAAADFVFRDQLGEVLPELVARV
jgi:NAD-dependent deacetylase